MADGLGFGLLLLGDQSPSHAIEMAVEAERVGFDSVWLADNPFFRGALPLAGALAIATSRLRIGVGVVNPYNRHPTLMAMEIPPLDELSNHRLIWGIGACVLQWVTEMGLAYDRPLAAVRDSVAIVRELLAGRQSWYQGRRFSTAGAQLDFEPARRDVPIYLASMATKSLEMCGEIGDGWIVSLFCSPGYLEMAMEHLRIGADQAGRDASLIDVVHYLPFSVHSDGQRARDHMKSFMASLLKDLVVEADSASEVKRLTREHSGLDEVEFRDMVVAIGHNESPVEAIPDKLLEQYAVAGSPDDCERVLRRYQRAGSREVVAFLQAGSGDLDMIRLIGA
ncbi:MAG: LLM class flavin-dependent oxidoreductase, partial [Chloroflexota bacterium]